MSKPRPSFRQPLLALSALCVAVLMAASPAEARRLKLGGFKSSPSVPAPAAGKNASNASVPGKGGTSLIVVPGVGAGATASKASTQETSPAQQRQILPARVDSPPVVKADVPTGPRSEVPVMGATASARPAPTSFATLN